MADDQNPAGFVPDPSPAAAAPAAGFVPDAPAASGFTPDATSATSDDDIAAKIRKQEQKDLAGGGNASLQPNNVTAGLSDEDRIRSFGYDPAKITKSGVYQFMKGHFGSGFNWAISPKLRGGFWDAYNASPVGGLEQGIQNTVLGLAQGAAHTRNALGLGGEEDANYFDMLARLHQEDYKQNILGGHDPNFLAKTGETLAPLLIPMGGEEYFGSKLLANAVKGAVTGAVQPVMVDPNNPNYAKQKGLQTGVGAATGAAIPPVFKGATNLAWRGINAFRKTALPEDVARDLQATISQKGLNGTWGDISDIETAANSGDHAAQKVLNNLNSAQAPGEIEQAAIGLQNFRTRQTSDGLWGAVGTLANKYGSSPATETLGTVSQAIDALEKIPGRSHNQGGLLAYLRAVRDNLLEKPNATDEISTETQKGIATEEEEQKPKKIDFDTLRGLESDLGAMYGEVSAGKNALIGKSSAPYIQRLREAVENDMDNFVNQHGASDLQKAYRAAKDYYRDYRVPFIDNDVARAGSTKEADTILDMFIKKGDHADRAAKLFNALDPRGQETVKGQMIEKLFKAATPSSEKQIMSQADPVKDAYVDPQKFLDTLEQYKEAFNHFFQGDDGKAMGGIENMMRHAVNARQKSAIPMGIAAGVGAAAAGAAHLPWSSELAGMGISASMIKAGMTTRAGRRILYNAMAAKPGSPAMAALVGQLRSIAPAVGRAGASYATQPPKGPIVVKPWNPNWQPPPGFAGGGLALEERMRRNLLESLKEGSAAGRAK